MNDDVQRGEMPCTVLKEGLCIRAFFIEKISKKPYCCSNLQRKSIGY